MWGDNTNGLSLTALLRPTDSSSAIRRNYNYIIIDSKLSAYLVILDVELFNTLTSLLLMLFENYYQLILLHVFCFPTFHKKFLIEFKRKQTWYIILLFAVKNGPKKGHFQI